MLEACIDLFSETFGEQRVVKTNVKAYTAENVLLLAN